MTKTIPPETDYSAEPFLEQCATRVVREITNNLTGYHDKPLVDAMRYATLNGGKRIRPGLVYATALALELDFVLVDPIACAIELIHCYSLAHDDLPAMDNDDMRRGQPACHKVFGEAEAILAGNAIQALAFECLANAEQLSDTYKLEAIRTLTAIAGLAGMASGQAMDIKGMDQRNDLQYIEKIHRLKTGSLMESCITIPLACKNNNSTIMHRALTSFAADIGLCFQIKDDILDASEQTKHSNYMNYEISYPALIGIDKTQKLLDILATRCSNYLKCVKEQTVILQAIARYIVTRNT